MGGQLALSQDPGRLRKRDRRAGAGGEIVQPAITAIIAGSATVPVWGC
jgi:hypothetical protein